MAAWDRKTPWRQGQALTNEAAVELGLVPEKAVATAVVLVVSHDCDITQDPEVEPSIEVFIGARVAAANGNFTHAKKSSSASPAARGGRLHDESRTAGNR
jgi:hypothetical protein